MKSRLLSLFAGLTGLGSGGKQLTPVHENSAKAHAVVEQRNLHLANEELETIFKKGLPLNFDMSLPYHARGNNALVLFVGVLYDYIKKLPHRSKEGNYFLINEIGLPLTNYLADLPKDEFEEIYESICSGKPVGTQTQAQYAVYLAQMILNMLGSKIRNHTTHGYEVITTLSSSTSLAQKNKQ